MWLGFFIGVNFFFVGTYLFFVWWWLIHRVANWLALTKVLWRLVARMHWGQVCCYGRYSTGGHDGWGGDIGPLCMLLNATFDRFRAGFYGWGCCCWLLVSWRYFLKCSVFSLEISKCFIFFIHTKCAVFRSWIFLNSTAWIIFPLHFYDLRKFFIAFSWLKEFFVQLILGW